MHYSVQECNRYLLYNVLNNISNSPVLIQFVLIIIIMNIYIFFNYGLKPSSLESLDFFTDAITSCRIKML